jgi:hypothetical protein
VPLLRATRTLLTSDRPLDMPYGLENENTYIALPVGPKMLFVAEKGDRWAKHLAASDHDKVVKSVNLCVTSQAHTMVWGVNEGQLAFVQRRMSAWPSPPILTEEQKAEAIRVVEDFSQF